jgi:hypothetical protein
MRKIAFCTATMNRTPNVARSLPHNLEVLLSCPQAAVLLLDYNSTDGLESSVERQFRPEVEQGRLLYCRTAEPRYFHMSHAKNVSHRLAATLLDARVLVNTDAEMLLPHGFAERVDELFTRVPKCVYTNHNGRLAIRSDHFLELGGYDESFNGWGMEDNDLRHRAQRLGLKHLQESSGGEIGHSDGERTANYDPAYRDKSATSAANAAIFRRHNADRVISVNQGRHWGRATVAVNWVATVTV